MALPLGAAGAAGFCCCALLMLVGLLVVLLAINYSIYAAYRDIYWTRGCDDGEPPVKAFAFRGIADNRMTGADRPFHFRLRSPPARRDVRHAGEQKSRKPGAAGDICLRGHRRHRRRAGLPLWSAGAPGRPAPGGPAPE